MSEIKQISLPNDVGVLHFSGIGGIGMSGIAEILHNLGYQVQGSDLNLNGNVQRLRDLGVKVFIGQEESNINGVSVIVRSSAIFKDNPEIIAAHKNKIPVISRVEMLAEIMRLKNCVAVAGTHGKTTTTSIIANVFEVAGLNPTVINGGILNSCNTNAYLGSGEWLIAEADESDGSFNKIPTKNIGVVTNIDAEHMEYYGSFAALRDAFREFISRIPFYGYAVVCKDSNEVRNLILEIVDRRIITYGFCEDVDIRGINLRAYKDGTLFDVVVNLDGANKIIKDLYLPMYGNHNVLNALAAISIAVKMKFSDKVIAEALEDFLGVKRRLTVVGKVKDTVIIDDYGHHPTEITASLKAARQMLKRSGNNGKLISIVQPHRYSRVHNFFNDFANCLSDSDIVMISDIYAAGEDPIEGISKESMVQAIMDKGNKSAYTISSLDDLPNYIEQHAANGDIIMCLGAGNITKYANELPKQLIDKGWLE